MNTLPSDIVSNCILAYLGDRGRFNFSRVNNQAAQIIAQTTLPLLEHLRYVSAFRDVEVVDLSKMGCALKNVQLMKLQHLHSIRELRVAHCTRLTDESLVHIAPKVTDLIDIRGCALSTGSFECQLNCKLHAADSGLSLDNAERLFTDARKGSNAAGTPATRSYAMLTRTKNNHTSLALYIASSTMTSRNYQAVEDSVPDGTTCFQRHVKNDLCMWSDIPVTISVLEIATTAIEYTVKRKTHIQLQELISRGARTDVHDGYGNTLLDHAVTRANSVGLVRVLISAGAEPGRRACASAARAGTISVMRWLLRGGGDVNSMVHGMTLLSIACDRGHLELVNFLLRRGASTQIGRHVPAWYAVAHGRSDILSILWENGWRPKDSDCLDKAISTENLSMVRWLVLHAKMVVTTPSVMATIAQTCNMSILSFAVRMNPHHIALARALRSAVSVGHRDGAQFLAGAGAPVNDQCVLQGRTPLYIALQSNCKEIAFMLLNLGADPTIPTSEGKLPIHLVDCPHLVSEILRWGRRQGNTAAMDGSRPLHEAARRGDVEVVEILANLPNIDLNAQRHDGFTPLDVAAAWQHPEVCRVLLSSRAQATMETPLLNALRTERECQWTIDRMLATLPPTHRVLAYDGIAAHVARKRQRLF